MGLESFKTEGPRTRSKSSSSSDQPLHDTVHVLDGIDQEQLDIPDSVVTHTIKQREMAVDMIEGVYETMFVCRECKSTSSSYEAKLKVDKLDYRDTDWYDGFMEQCLALADEVLDDTTHDEEIDSHYDGDHSDEYDDTSDDSSNDDDDFDSGLSAFTS